MNKHYTYKTKNGLKVIFQEQKGFVKSYCGIGVKFGGANIKYQVGDKKFETKSGIAHFIEHKLFQMPDGSDAFITFSKQNAEANAYTTPDKTIYHFTKNQDVYTSLKLLLDMFFTPVFKDMDVEREKQIIISEIDMYDDKVDYHFYQKGLNMLFPEDDYSKPVAGTAESVNATTAQDMLDVYNAFYRPNNSVLVVVGDLDKQELFDFIEENTSMYMQNKSQSCFSLPTISSKKIALPLSYQDKTTQDKVQVLIRFNNVTNVDINSCDILAGVLDCVFSLASPFYQFLERKGLFENDIDFQVVTSFDGAYAIIDAPSKNGEHFAKTIIKKLKSLTKEDLPDELIDIYLKHIKARSIRSMDSIESLGDNILSLALEDIDYYQATDELLNMTKKQFYEEIPLIREANMTYLILTKKSEKNA